jgi:Chain length determinant protein
VGLSRLSEDYERARTDTPLAELLGLLRRRHRVIIWVVVALTSIATFIGLQTTKFYTATTLVMIQPRGDRVVDVEQVVQALSADAEVIETQIKLIQSHENLARTVDKLNMHAERALFSGDESSGRVKGAIAGLLPDEWLIGADEWLIAAEKWLVAAGLAKVSGTEANPEELREQVIEALQGNLKVIQSGRSHDAHEGSPYPVGLRSTDHAVSARHHPLLECQPWRLFRAAALMRQDPDRCLRQDTQSPGTYGLV